MARGRPTDPKKVEEILQLYVHIGNISEVSRRVGIPIVTALDIINNPTNADKIEKYREQKKEAWDKEFAEKCDEIIAMGLSAIRDKISAGDAPLNHLTTAVGTIYDKKALNTGRPTENTAVTVNMEGDVDGLAELLGYTKKADKQ